MYYCIMRAKKNENTAGIKAPDDIVQICSENGFSILRWDQFPTDKSVLYKKLWILTKCNIQWVDILSKTIKEDVVLYQHPSYGYRNGIFWVKKLQKKGVKTIALIHDLESLRKGIVGGVSYNQSRSDRADNRYLKMFDIVICHNDKMREYLIRNGFDPKKLISLQIFDYLWKGDVKEYAKSGNPSIAIAGNLVPGKCSYIYEISGNGDNQNLTVHLYGSGFKKEQATSNMIYHGSFKPDELPGILEGDFGLVWDGNSAETCAGNTGEYLRYNNPHKTSLYLASGIPVIVWSKAAIADFVLGNGVGITVDNLYELEDKCKQLTKEEYDQLRENAFKVGKLLREGFYTQKALDSALDKLSGK